MADKEGFWGRIRSAQGSNPSTWKKMRTVATDYAQHATIHGLNYVAEEERTFGERLIWFLLWVGSIGLCFYGMQPIYQKWQNSPTITSIEDTNYAVWNINFPAVTVCSNNKAVKKKVAAVVKKNP